MRYSLFWNLGPLAAVVQCGSTTCVDPTILSFLHAPPHDEPVASPRGATGSLLRGGCRANLVSGRRLAANDQRHRAVVHQADSHVSAEHAGLNGDRKPLAKLLGHEVDKLAAE